VRLGRYLVDIELVLGPGLMRCICTELFRTSTIEVLLTDAQVSS
jgi:hypothetical protein